MTSRVERIPPERIAQASAWVATLHGDRRTAQTEKAFQRWLGEDSLNAEAFEQITELWSLTGALPRRLVDWPTPVSRPGLAIRKYGIAVGLALTFALGVVAYYLLQAPRLSTETGEQRIVALEDGTQVTLNTDTRLTYRFSKKQRDIRLEHGEALFEVAKDRNRPFTVTAARHTITALGTRFTVRSDEINTAVTLIEGKVSVSGADGPSASLANNAPNPREPGAPALVLHPGQRLTFVGASTPKIDEPVLDNVLAWKRREVFLNETPLEDAVAEMNRYSRKELRTTGAVGRRILVTGLFRAGDSLSFARAVADTYGLEVRETADEISLEAP